MVLLIKGRASDGGGEQKASGPEESVSVAKDAAVTSTRVPYKNGYWDFYFGSRPDSRALPYMSENEKGMILGLAGSNGVPIIELDNFQQYASVLKI